MTEAFVYVAGSSRDGPVKIGTSVAPADRLGALQVGSAVRLHLYWKASVPAARAYSIENDIHRLLASDRMTGEWFAVPIEIAVETVMRVLAPRQPLTLVPDEPEADDSAAADEREADVVWLGARRKGDLIYDPPREWANQQFFKDRQ